MHTPGSVPRKSASRSSAPRLLILAYIVGALIVGLASASAPLARAQEPTSQTPPAQPTQPASQPGAAQHTPDQQSPAATTPAPTPAQTPASTNPDATQTQAPASAAPPNYSVSVVKPTPKTPSGTTTSGPAPSASDSILESELRTLLVGKPLFLRGCYMSDDLRFNERGGLYGSSPRGSFTLSGIQIERLRLTRKELILEGDRYGYRFLGALPGNNPTDDMERIKITPKKKVLRIRIERQEVESPKKEKAAKPSPDQPANASKPPADAQATSTSSAVTASSDAAAAPSAQTAPGAEPNSQAATAAQPSNAPEATDSAKSGALKDEPVTTSAEHAVQRLKDTLARLFTPSLDDRFVGSMPPFWQLYYKSLAAKSDFQPSDPGVLRRNQVDKQPRLISAIDPPSNPYAQEYGVVGQALYHVVVGPDGKPSEIAIGQPIGFGLDENAIETLEKATFEPAMKDGKPVPVVLPLSVQFHIYSKLTSGTSKPDKDAKPALPGPYSLPPKQ